MWYSAQFQISVLRGWTTLSEACIHSMKAVSALNCCHISWWPLSCGMAATGT